MSDAPLFTFQVKHGYLYLQVVPADISIESRWSEEAGTYLATEVVTPLIRVSSAPEWAEVRDMTGENIVIRGRKYGTWVTYEQLPEGRRHQGWDGKPVVWDTHRGHTNRRYKSNGVELSFRTKTYDELHAKELAALEHFDAVSPNWREESKRLAFEAERDRSDQKADELQAEAIAATRKAREWQKRIDALALVTA